MSLYFGVAWLTAVIAGVTVSRSSWFGRECDADRIAASCITALLAALIWPITVVAATMFGTGMILNATLDKCQISKRKSQ